ncbi:hypothetical protein D5018_09710 [Parashewanella curva]|uniref:Uncharacterized protein n=1 Tax=Parashewanella curva TaxID=2338552 RepID=A0A3L8PX30_9GAMM|nr:hypothetical protein [Parashewanella curva]RLV59946.1 hypothetical protein D5018_09710 [Parashewanella curva]
MLTYFETPAVIDTGSLLPYLITILILLMSYRGVKVFHDRFIKQSLKIEYYQVVILLVICCCFSLIAINQDRGLIEQVTESKIFTVTGEVTNLHTEKAASREESFEVSGVKFSYNDVATPKYFFANRKYQDGIIQNGRKVKVEYIKDDETNLIIRLDFKATN